MNKVGLRTVIEEGEIGQFELFKKVENYEVVYERGAWDSKVFYTKGCRT